MEHLEHKLAIELIYRLDLLIAAIGDDPVLTGALLRERDRVLDHLERCLSPRARRWPGLLLERLAAPPIAARPARKLPALRGSCYRALSADLLDGRRFDALMLLFQRAQVGSSSPSPSPSLPASGGGAGSSFGSTALDSPRRKRSRRSTIRTWA